MKGTICRYCRLKNKDHNLTQEKACHAQCIKFSKLDGITYEEAINNRWYYKDEKYVGDSIFDNYKKERIKNLSNYHFDTLVTPKRNINEHIKCKVCGNDIQQENKQWCDKCLNNESNNL